MRYKKLLKILKSLVGSAATADPDGMSTVAGGSAIAFGDNTLASGQISGKTVDKGGYTVAKGSVTFTGAAQSDEAGAVAAGATTFAAVSGADLVMTFTFDQATIGSNSVVVRSTTKYIAVDYDGWAPTGGPIVMQMNSSLFLSGPFKPFKGIGNLATIDAAAYSKGDHSLASTLTESLSIQGTMSAVSGMAVMAVT